MKDELTSLDLFYLLKELKQLEGSKLEKAYEQDEDKKDFLLAFHKPGTGKLMLRVKLPGLSYLTLYKPAFPDSPPGFCVFLRKHLGNARVKEVRQKGFERILEIVFDTKSGERILLFELFSKGNVLLLDEGYNIKGLLESQNWQSRTIRGGTKYSYPPSQTDTPRITISEFKHIISSSELDSIVKILALEMGLGGFYAEELCKLAGVSKETKRLSPGQVQALYAELSRLFMKSIMPNTSAGHTLPFQTSSTIEKTFETFSTAIDHQFTERIELEKNRGQEKEKLTKKKKSELVIEKQQERLKQLEKSIIENQRIGELIYENYDKVKSVLEMISSERKNVGWSELKKRHPDIIIDEKKGTIVVSL